MRGYPFYNYPAFDHAYGKLLMRFPEANIVSPANIDRMLFYFDAMKLPYDHNWKDNPPIPYMEVIAQDIEYIKKCYMVYALKGWEKSIGALAEVALARWLGKHIEEEV